MNVNASPFFTSPFSRRRAGVVGGGYHHLGPFFLATCSTHTTHRDTFTLLVPSLCLRVGTFGHQQLLRCVCVCVCGTVCRAVSLYLFPSHRRLLGEKQNKRKQVKKKKKKNGQSSEFVRAAHPQGLPSRGHTLAEFTQTGRTFAQVKFVCTSGVYYKKNSTNNDDMIRISSHCFKKHLLCMFPYHR